MKLFILLADLNDADSQASMQKLKNQIHTSADFRSVPDFIRKIDAILSAYLSRDPSAPSKLEKFLTDFPLWDENRKIQRDPSESPRKPL